jgi:ABC-type sugar transport system permease subunit
MPWLAMRLLGRLQRLRTTARRPGGLLQLFQWNGLGAPTDFVGFDNVVRVVGDGTFRNALVHNIIILVLSIALQLPLYVLSDVITGVVWTFVYKPDNGLLNSILVQPSSKKQRPSTARRAGRPSSA